MALNIKKIREDFPILKRRIHGKPLVYLDSAATSQKPKQVLEAMDEFYRNHNANVHRGICKLSQEATLAYEEAHTVVSDFINASGMEEIVFTKNTTESLNLAAYSLIQKLKPGDNVVISQMEHHANFVPWQQLCKRFGIKLKFCGLTPDLQLDMKQLSALIDNNTKIVSIGHVSNVLGTINPVKEIAKVAHDHGAYFIVDAAQSVPKMPIDVKKIDCDFLAFSGHKMLGPTGIGVLYGKKEVLESMSPFLYGGEMISKVSFKETTFNELPWKFEAGTMNIAEAVGLKAAIDYLKKVGMENIHKHDLELVDYAVKKLGSIKNITLYGPKKRSGVVSFNVEKIHAHDMSTILDEDAIAIRGGNHCAQPLMSVLDIAGTSRASFYLYNTKEEIDLLAKSIEKAKKVFGV